MNAGDTFLITEPGTSYDSHLWMVISDPSVDPHFVLVVNFTSWREDKDQSCIVEPSEHPYVKKRTIVNYAKAKHLPVVRLAKLIASGQIKAHTPLSETLLTRIRKGAGQSKQMELGHWQILAEQGLVPD